MHQHVDLVLSVTVASDKPLFTKDLQQGFQFQIHTWGHGSATRTDVLAFGASQGRAVFNLSHPIFPCPDEMVVIDLLHPHSRLGKARSVPVSPIALFDIFPQSKLDEGNRILEQQILRSGTPTELDDGTLSANWIGGTMQNLGTSDTARKLTVHVHVLAVHSMANPNLCAACLCAFVDTSVHGDVGVLVNDARGDVFAPAVDFNGHHPCRQKLRRLKVGPNGHDLAPVQKHIGLLQHTLLLAGPHCSLSNPRGFLAQRLGQPIGGEGVNDTRKVEC